MYSMDDILARLKNGESSSTIADEMAAALNKAITAYEDTKVQKQKEEDGDKIAALLVQYIKDYYPDYYLEMGPIGLTSKDIDDMVCNLVSLTDIFNSFNLTKPDKKKKSNSPDDVIKNFLKDMGL